MKNLCLFINCLLIFMGAGCKKDAVIKQSINSAPSNTPVANSDSYLPLTSGNMWVYSVSDPTRGIYIDTIKMTGKASVFHGQTFYESSVSSVTDTSGHSYYAATDHLYTTRVSVNDKNLGQISAEYPMGDDSKAEGYSWTIPMIDTVGEPQETISVVKEKNISKIVNGKTFDNVIHTQVTDQTQRQILQILDFYLAKGVGLIQESYYFPDTKTTTTKT